MITDKEKAFQLINPEYLYFHHQEFSEDLWADRDFVHAAVACYGQALKFAYPAYKADREIISTALKASPLALKYAADFLQNDEEIIALAMEYWPCALKYASPELQNDKEFAIRAVTKHSYLLKYLPQFQNDYDVVSAAGKYAFQYASEDIKDKFSNRPKSLLEILCDKFMSPENIFYDYGDIPERIWDYKDVSKMLVAHDGNALKYASARLKADRDIALTAIAQNENAVRYASTEIQLALKDDSILYAVEVYNHLDVFKERYPIVMTYGEAEQFILDHPTDLAFGDRYVIATIQYIGDGVYIIK